MPFYVYLASAGVVSALGLLRWGFAGGQHTSHAAKANLGGVAAKSTTLRGVEGSPLSRLVDRIPYLTTSHELGVRIARAGLPWTVASVQLFRVWWVAACGLLGALLAVATKSAGSVIVLFALLAALGLVLPGIFITRRGEARQQELELQLPDILDRLTIAIEAGLGFDSALDHVVAEKTGPGYDEFRRVLQDLKLGVPRDVALGGLAERTSVQDLRIVLGAILQSGKYGLPLAGVLRIQTTELREKRWARAQEMAMKIPVKILFPLLFCILPTLFLVIIGPAAIRISNSFTF